MPVERTIFEPCRAIAAAVSALLLLGVNAMAGDALIAVQPVEPWSAVFAGDSTEWAVRMESRQSLEGRCLWSLRVADRVLTRHESAVQVEAGQSLLLKTQWQWPVVRDGLVLEGQCVWQLINDTTEMARCEKPVFIFPRAAFAGRTQWLKALKLHLYDPAGQTHECFNREEIPHRLLRRDQSFDDMDEGLLLIGEGQPLRGSGRLFEDLLTVAKRGVPVLCLATSDGEQSWPAADPGLTGISLRQSDVIRQFDKRFDAEHWPDGRSFQRGLSLTVRRDGLRAETVSEGVRWPWCEWQVRANVSDRIPQHDDRPVPVIWCGFRIIDGWDHGPVPRFLLKAMLEHMQRPARME